MCNFKSELSTLLSPGNLGFYTYCEVKQIVFLLDDKRIINYFTHINFSSRYTATQDFTFLTASPQRINSKISLAISTYILPVSEVEKILLKAINTGVWEYNGSQVIVDDAFVSNSKFIPQNDPAVSQYNCFVPIEYALYRSTFNGNYYLFELFSRKTVLNQLLDKTLRYKVQELIKQCKLDFRLDKLTDRVGNIICKFEVEIFKSTAIRLGSENGIAFTFEYSEDVAQHGLTLSVVQEHDNIIYTNKIIRNFVDHEIEILPNQCKTQISIVDDKTSLTLFYGIFDYRSYSGYYSQINLQNIIARPSQTRVLHIGGHDEIIELLDVSQAGEYIEFIEMSLSSERKKLLEDNWFVKNGYLKSYTKNQHDEALDDIVSILNKNRLLWDLQEIWIIDPYLCAKDIISTAFKCQKPNIKIKALCAYATIHGNREVRTMIGHQDFNDFKQKQQEEIKEVLGEQTDIKLDYRTVYSGYGVPFHDRYIMMKFNINKSRVWSLGASLNAIGSTHSIIQIVEAPNKIISLFEDIWSQTHHEECCIFSNSSEEDFI